MLAVIGEGGKTWWNSCRADLGKRGKYFVWPQRLMAAPSGRFLLMLASTAIIKVKRACRWWTSCEPGYSAHVLSNSF